jgi:prolyl-tRNA editing enzyme YbaK/EbsC (Cys-tRNA(Pro) deacylase)/glyoxylase-like metal-dependent hydrolase (beta-lactamase superfamily II)
MPKDLELIKISGGSHYISGGMSFGVYVKDGKAILFDTGIDKSAAKAIEAALKANGIVPVAIINSHHHVDHIGGNPHFQSTYPGIQIIATKFESAFIENKGLETSCFCGHSEPHSGLAGNRHIEGPESVVTNKLTEYKDQDIELLGETFKIVTLPGHTDGMIGVITPDNILYCGDAIFNGDTYAKHPLPLYTSVGKALKTFDKLAQLTIAGCVFYHSGYVEKINDICDMHKQRMLQTADVVCNFIDANPGITLDLLTQLVMQHFKLEDNHVKLALTRTSVGAFVTYLEQEKRLELTVRDGLSCITGMKLKLAAAQEAKARAEAAELSANAKRVQDALLKKGVALSVREMPSSTKTAEEAAATLECSIAQIVKSLVFKTSSGQPVLVLTSGANQVDLSLIKAQLSGQSVDRADAKFVKEVTGFTIGGIPPVGHTKPIPCIFIDDALMQQELLWAAAGMPNAVFSLSPEQLKEITNGKVIKVAAVAGAPILTAFSGADKADPQAGASAKPRP